MNFEAAIITKFESRFAKFIAHEKPVSNISGWHSILQTLALLMLLSHLVSLCALGSLHIQCTLFCGSYCSVRVCCVMVGPRGCYSLER